MIAVLGANGQLGKSLQKLWGERKDVLFWSSDDVDITCSSKLGEKLSLLELGDTVVNCAAYTAVDQAEEEIEKCFKVNAEAPGVLAQMAASKGLKLVHISTDYVFDGQQNEPYQEDSPTSPLNQYGQSKREGEKRILAAGGPAVVIRTSWLYSEFNRNFFLSMLKLGQQKKELKIVNDQWGTPTFALDLAKVINKVVENFPEGSCELYHYSNDGIVSWCEFAQEIMERAKLPCRVVGISSEEYPTKAKRPKYTVLSKEKIKHQFDIGSADWKESVSKCLKELS